jgi:hypothetical protein
MKLFYHLVAATSEGAVQDLLGNNSQYDWHPLGGSENNFGVIENQQASPIAALIEKLTNSIDAILMRRCLESGIGPKSSAAPKSMHGAIETFFAQDYKNWHLTGIRRKQAQAIQILASGSRTKPCLMIYDDGEGQHPGDFERTFLSLLQGNKNEISFVQGKYNMGGTGAIVFCGEHRYQLIASKRFDGSGDFGFTLIRKHPLSAEEKKTKKNTWYEYLKIDGKIPSFPITELDLGLAGRKFMTGTIIKLFDYQLPSGSRGGLPQEVRRSLNQFLFEPALPIYLKDSPERYPNNKVLEGDTFGLKRRLEEDDSKYIEEHFTDELSHKGVGTIKATCYVFKAKVDGKSVKETRDNIGREFFPDGMCVLFSLNGQVHGHRHAVHFGHAENAAAQESPAHSRRLHRNGLRFPLGAFHGFAGPPEVRREDCGVTRDAQGLGEQRPLVGDLQEAEKCHFGRRRGREGFAQVVLEEPAVQQRSDAASESDVQD